MSYDSRYGITKICAGKIDNLSISRDDMDEGVIPVLLYTPHMSDTNAHYHIELNKSQAKHLRDWLTRYLNEDPKELK